MSSPFPFLSKSQLIQPQFSPLVDKSPHRGLRTPFRQHNPFQQPRLKRNCLLLSAFTICVSSPVVNFSWHRFIEAVKRTFRLVFNPPSKAFPPFIIPIEQSQPLHTISVHLSTTYHD